jgi:hypothetical protein
MYLNFEFEFFFSKVLFKKDDVCNKRTLCKILAVQLSKIICLCSLWKICGWNVWLCICVQRFSFLLRVNFHKRFYLSWWKKWNCQIFFTNIGKMFWVTISFDLWSSKEGRDIFLVVIKFCNLITNQSYYY